MNSDMLNLIVELIAHGDGSTRNRIFHWFGQNDQFAVDVLNQPGNAELKTNLIEQKLPALLKNQDFVLELAGWEHRKPSIKNAVLDSRINVKGNVSIGKDGKPDDEFAYQKNAIIEGSTVTAGGDIWLVGQQIMGDKNIYNFYSGATDNPKTENE